jgi:peptidoglycan hydrolase-like protein with peptidoglycan-binding domain
VTTLYQDAQDTDTPFRRWRFEETSGMTFTDDVASSVATSSGSVTAGVTSTMGRPALGLGADFAGGYTSVGSASGWSSLLTIEALVQLDTTPASLRPAFFTHAWTTGQKIPLVLGFNIDNAHANRLGFGYFDGTSWRAVHMPTALSTGAPHHIVGVYDGTTGLTLWVDGASVATATVTARSAGTLNATAYIGRRWDQTDAIDGRIWDLALYTSALSSTRVGVHAATAAQFAGVVVSGGGHPVITTGSGIPRVRGDGVTVSGGGSPRFTGPGLLLVPGDGTTWGTYGELSSQPASPGGVAQTWRYRATDTGTLDVDTAGTGWNTVLTVYAADRSTVLGTSSTPGGAAAVSVAVTAGTTYYVTVSRGSGASDADGRYLLNATGPRSAEAPQVEWPAPAAPSIPSAGSPPAGMTVVPVQRMSVTMPAPSITAGRPVQPWTGSVARSDWGTFRVVVQGTDVTYFRGAPVRVGSFELMEPFGCGPAEIAVPAVTPHDTPGSGDTAWLVEGNSVDIVGPAGTLWSGVLAKLHGSYDGSGCGITMSCIGDIWPADLVAHQPRTYLPPVDVGSMVAVVLNLVPHRRINGITQVITGIKTTQRGSADTSVIGYVQELLGTAGTSAGGQWTIARTSMPRTYEVRLKDRSTVTWHVRAGQPGVELQLERDATVAVQRIYGRGVAPNGYAWAGWVYPRTGIAAAPAYPNASPSSVLTVGSTDASTTSGSGVSDWQERINSTGLAKVAVDGTYDAADAAAARLVQTKGGLTVDGIVGPQTWASTFDVGNDGTDLTAAYRAPLAATTGATPTLTNADGSTGGANPGNVPNLLIVDRDEDFGDGITKAQAIVSAQAELARTSTSGWVGTVALKADPEDVARWDIKEGSNGVIKGWAGSDITVHVSGVRVEPPSESNDTGSVTLTVDEKARDLVTIGAILRRDRDAARNPAMMPPRKQRRSQSRPDSVVEYDGESSGGIIPKHALYGGLWTVIRIPVSQAGKVARVVATTASPATRFVLAFFGDAVTPADLRSLVGSNPLAERGDGMGPFDWNADKLAERGFVEALGGPGQSCGFSPGYETSPHSGTSTGLTGKLDTSGSWTYQSVKPPWLWLAEWAESSTFISGRIYPAPLDT